MLVADITSTSYEITLTLHVLTAMAGLGVTFWFGVYGVRAQQAGQSGDAMGSAAIAEATVTVADISKWAIYAIPLLGIGLVFMSDEAWGFDQTWVWLSLVLFAVALLVATTVLLPSGREFARLGRALASGGPSSAGGTGPPPQVERMDAIGKRLAAFSGVNHLIVVVILYLMIAKPGL